MEETDRQMTVKANPYLLKIALKNIIDNACKYSDKEVNVTLYREQQQVILDIEDRGIGIPQEEIEHIFQSFIPFSLYLLKTTNLIYERFFHRIEMN